MRAKRPLAALLIALACRETAVAAEPEPPRLAIVYRKDRLSVRLERVPLEQVLTEIAANSGAEIRGAPLNSREVTAEFEDVPLPEAMHRLLGDQNFMLRYTEGDRLRTIELFGKASDAPQVTLAAASSPNRSPAAGSPLPQEVAVAMSALAKHPPVPVQGALAAALGSDKATLPQLLEASARQQDPAVRGEAFRASLSAFEAEPELRSKVIHALDGADDAALSKALRGAAGLRAEELANQLASEAQTPELRAKALSILNRLRATASAD
jgi:hypothetical protein